MNPEASFNGFRVYALGFRGQGCVPDPYQSAPPAQMLNPKPKNQGDLGKGEFQKVESA